MPEDYKEFDPGPPEAEGAYRCNHNFLFWDVRQH